MYICIFLLYIPVVLGYVRLCSLDLMFDNLVSISDKVQNNFRNTTVRNTI